MIALGVLASGTRTYRTELEIVAPASLEGRRLSVSSNAPLPIEHFFRKTGSHVRLSIVGLESGRGTSLVPAEGVTRIIYDVKIENVRDVTEEPSKTSVGRKDKRHSPTP